MANKYVIISNSYTTEGNGASYAPFTWSQFLTDISGGGVEGLGNNIDYYLSGTRSLTDNTIITVSALGTINLYSWSANNSIAIIENLNNDVYFEQYCPNLGLYDLMIQASMSSSNNNLFDDGYRSPAIDYGNLIIDNCYLKIGTNARITNLSSVIIRNSIIISNRFQGSCSTSNGMSVELYNNIFDINNFTIRSINNIKSLTVDNCAFTSALTAFTEQETSDWTNIHESWTRPSIFSSAVSAINISANLKYIDSPFSLISATGSTSYNRTWLNGRRDGIGALYFPQMSGFAVSASSASAPLDYSLNFIISGNDPFTVFSASSATYDWDDTTSNSAVNNNNVISHSFSANGSYEVEAVIKSFNEWYEITATSWTVLVGNFNVTIVIYDRFGNDITGLSSKPLNELTFSAYVNGLDAGSYLWDLGDGYSGTTNPYYQSYLTEGTKSIKLSAFASDDPTTSAIDTSTISISAISAEYYVNIMSAYDVCANNTGTSADPFNWSEFKGRVETSGEFLDTYRLSGSRLISATVENRNVLNIDKTKNFTIRDWSVSSFGPWVLETKDCSNSDENSILSAAGCTLRNGIIYNKPFGTTTNLKGGQIIIGKTYDMFIVYQGNYSHIIVDPYQNILSGGLFSAISAFTVWSATSSVSGTSSDYCENPSWNNLPTYIEESFEGGSANAYWPNCLTANPTVVGITSSSNIGSGVWGISGVSPLLRSFYLTPSATPISGNFDIECVIINPTSVSASFMSLNIYRHEVTYSADNSWPAGYECGKDIGGFQQSAYEIAEISPFNPNQVLGVQLYEVNQYLFSGIFNGVSLTGVSGITPCPFLKFKIVRSGHGTPDLKITMSAASAASRTGPWNWVDSERTMTTATSPSAYSGNVAVLVENGTRNSTDTSRCLLTDIKFQSDGGFPNVSTVSSNSATPPDWVVEWAQSRNLSAGFWIEDDFETSSFNCWWDSNFKDSYSLSSVSGSEVAVMKLKDSTTPFRLLSRNGTSLSGDFIFETSIFKRSGSSYIQGISVYALSANINNLGDWNNASGSIARISVNYLTPGIFGSNFNIPAATTGIGGPTSSDTIGLKLQRNNGIISAFYKDGESNWQETDYTNISYSNNVYAVVEGNGYEAFDYFRIAAQSGLPNTFELMTSSVSSVSSVTVMSGSPGILVTCADAKIIGSTIYLSGDGWKDNFVSGDYSDINQENYILEITDSVMTNFEKEESSDFSACNISANNSTFNRSQTAIENDFNINQIDCQFDWNEPTDYPFTPNNDLFNKDITYIRNNKKKLKPFSGINIPPNPGKNYPTYPNYETGLFGYSRKDYNNG